MSDKAIDLFVTATEINDHHGVGIFLRRSFPDSSGAASLRSRTLYGGEEPFASHHWVLDSRFLPLQETERRLRTLLSGFKVRRILAVPYYREDFIHAILAHKLTGAPLCSFVMDDQNVFAKEVPDHWVDELLSLSKLRLGISPELCEAYRLKFGKTLHTMPPVLSPGPEPVPNHWIPGIDSAPTCAMIGNVWRKSQFDRLRRAVSEAGIRVHWFGNGPKAPWLGVDQAELEREGIQCMGFIEERTLASLLSSYPLVLVPGGTMDDEDDNPSFSRLSLPSRVLFVAARANVPILILGHGESAAGRFVRRLKIGNCCAYTAESLAAGISLLTDPKRHPKLCQRLLRASPFLQHPNPGAWIWESLEAGVPQPAPWEKAFAPRRTWYGRSLERPAPLEITRWKPPLPVQAPSSWAEASLETLSAFSLTRRWQTSFIRPGPSPLNGDSLDIGTLLRGLTQGLALRFGRAGGRWLVIGSMDPGFPDAIPPGTELWQIEDTDTWQAEQCRDESRWFRLVRGGGSATPGPFDVMISQEAGSFVREPDVLKFPMWNSFLSRNSRQGALHAHAFHALLQPERLTLHPLYGSMLQTFPQATGVGLDEILNDQEVWTMGEQAYDQYWKPHTGKLFRDFGQLLGLIVAWQHTDAGASQPGRKP